MSKKLLPLTKNKSGEYEPLVPTMGYKPIHYQSKTEVDEPEINVWDGVTYDGSWWNESSPILNIDTAAQVADFFRNQNNYKLDGKTVNFNNNFYMNLNYKDCHNWTDTSNDFYWIKPNGKCVVADNNNTETIIDGKCHTIYGLAICDYSTSERNAIMTLNNIATIKDLRFDGLWSWEKKSYGRLFKFYYGRGKIYNVVLCNSNIVDYGFSSYSSSVVNFGDYSKGNNEVNMVLYNNKLNITNSPGFMGRAVYGTNVKYNVCAYSNIAVNSGILFPVSQLTVDSGSNYEYYDMGGFTNSGISCDSVESLIESYNSNHVFSNERELYIDEDNNPTFWDESHERYEKDEIAKIPEGSEFLWLASNYDTSNKLIKNDIPGATMFDTLYDKGSLTKNGFGGNCYLSGTSNSNYLYRNLDTNELNICKSNNSGQCFTYIIKASADPNQIGGLLSFRNDGTMIVYCIRTYGGKIYYTYTNYNTTDSSIDFIDENIYMFVIKPTTTIIRNLTNGFSKTITTSTARGLRSNFRIMNAGFNNENGITKFFGCYGASKELNEQEVESVKRILEEQNVYKWYKLGDPKLLLINPKNVRK